MSALATIGARLAGDAGGRRVVTPERRRRRRVQAVWGLLVLNVLTFFPGSPHLLPIPGMVGKLIAQASRRPPCCWRSP